MYEHLVKQAIDVGFKIFCVRAMLICHDEVLLIQRSFKDSMPGIYEMPGGCVDPHENLEEALFREVKEETGIDIKTINYYLGHFDYISKKNNNASIRQFNFVSKIESKCPVVISSEHDNYRWINLNQINGIDLPINDQVFKLIDEYKKLKM